MHSKLIRLALSLTVLVLMARPSSTLAQTVVVSEDVSVAGASFADMNLAVYTHRGGLYTGLDGLVGWDSPTRFYLKFLLPAFVPGTEVSGAVLSGFYNDDFDATFDTTHSIYLAANDTWGEAAITFNNQPGPTGGAIAQFDAAAATVGTWQAWDITAAVNGKYQSTGVLSLVMLADDETLSETNFNWEYFASKEFNPDLAFRLDLRVTPSAPVPEPGVLALAFGAAAGLLPALRRARRR